MSALKLTVPLTGLLAVAVLSPAVSTSASLALWRVAVKLARELERPEPSKPQAREGPAGEDSEQQRLIDELYSARAQAEETEKKLKKTISDLEEFALLAVRRELHMQELSDM